LGAVVSLALVCCPRSHVSSQALLNKTISLTTCRNGPMRLFRAAVCLCGVPSWNRMLTKARLSQHAAAFRCRRNLLLWFLGLRAPEQTPVLAPSHQPSIVSMIASSLKSRPSGCSSLIMQRSNINPDTKDGVWVRMAVGAKSELNLWRL